MTYEILEGRIAAWAAGQADIRAVVSVGSRARGGMDRWSDLDVLLLTREPDRYLTDGWLHLFGEPWLTYLEQTGGQDPEWYAFYVGDLKLDIALLQVETDSRDLPTLLAQYPYTNTFARGTNVLFDQYGEPRMLPPGAVPPKPLPSVAEFEEAVGGFLVGLVTAAKFVARGDYWRAQHRIAGDVRPRLLKLMEWQVYGKDTWYGGRFLREWADPRVVEALPGTFAGYDRAGLHGAITALMELFRWLSEATAGRFGWQHPGEKLARTAAMIEAIFAEA